MIRIGIDIGGTFTDFALWRGDPAGYVAVESLKLPSTPPRFDEAVVEGVTRLLCGVEAEPDEPIVVVHGTTVSTNAVIERSAPPIAMLVTDGYRDLLDLQRLRLARPVDMFASRAPALIPRECVHAVRERTLAEGVVRAVVNRADVEAAADAVVAAGIDTLAVCFLNAYRNPANEQAAKAIVQAYQPRLRVVLSSEVWNQQGEYERAVVTTLNAYVEPVITSYVEAIESFLHTRFPHARLFITRSNGGAMSAEQARRSPVHTLLSGPASGVTGAVYLARALDEPAMLTMDMGGTSTDLSLVVEAKAQVSTEAEVGDFPLMMPVTAIEAIGAGGGSIAWLDGPVLKVGPRSAGARPGPACYGLGGELPTLSDAYVVCGYLNPSYFLGGQMPLDAAKAESALRPLADALGMDVTAVAEACVTVGTSNMLASVLPFLARLGVSPGELTLVLFGGAGAVHGPLLAEEMGIARVVVPRTPSVFCALGGLVSDLVHDEVRTVHGLDLDIGALRDGFAALEGQARAWLADQVEPEVLLERKLERYAEMRYLGQSFQVDVLLSEADLAPADLSRVHEAFHREHHRLYSHQDLAAPVEMVGLRVRVRAAMNAPNAAHGLGESVGAVAAPNETRRMRFNGAWYDRVPVHRRAELGHGSALVGPAVVEQNDATVLVPPGYRAEVGHFGDLVLEKES